MIFSDLIEELKQKEIEISFSAGKLKYSGPDENITPELIENLKKFKGKLLKSFWPKELGNLMPINPEGNKIPLFVIHGDNANYLISEYLGANQPVYGFFHPGSEGEKIPYKSVKEMAKSYLDKVKSVNPTGPYYLIGYSFGGNLAFEMALQLQKEGKKVPLLVLLDSMCPSTKDKIIWEKGLFRILRKNFLGPVRRSVERFFKLLVCELYILKNVPIPVSRRTFYMWIKYLKLSGRYSPGKFDGNMLLFRTIGNPFSYKTLDWKNLVNNIKMIEIEGKHLDIFVGKERIELIQKEIEKYLRSVNELN
jgi:thioesterase domain-containing protein